MERVIGVQTAGPITTVKIAVMAAHRIAERSEIFYAPATMASIEERLARDGIDVSFITDRLNMGARA